MLYPDLLLLDPEREAEAGDVRIVEAGQETWRCEYAVRDVFAVRYGEAHASWWEWTAAG